MEEKRPFWLDMDGGDTIQFFDQVYRVKASGAQTGGLFGLVEVSTPQGVRPPAACPRARGRGVLRAGGRL
jgi:hypothetical protein